MAHVVGIPIIKGNSHSILSCRFTGDISNLFEGAAVKQVGGVAERQVKLLSETGAGEFVGFIFDINPKSKRCSLLRACDLVALPCADKSALTLGDQLKINPTNNMIDAAGTLVINGKVEVVDAAFEGLSGKTGKPVNVGGTDIDCVGVSLSQVQVMPTSSGGVEEAPSDGKQYGRQDGGWTEITSA